MDLNYENIYTKEACREGLHMGLLDGFTLYDDSDIRFYITLRDKSITFSKTIIDVLRRPAFVHMYIDKDGKRVAFQPSEEDAAAISFYKEPKHGRQIICRITDTKIIEVLSDLSGMIFEKKGIRFYGDFIQEENIIVINLNMSY